MNISRVRLAFAVLTLLVVSSACNVESLLGPDGVTGEWLAEVETTEDADSPEVKVRPDLRDASLAIWTNDDLAVVGAGEGTTALEMIWAATNGEDRFVQVARQDITKVLPDVFFPEFVPESVGYISTQLVFLPRTGQLARSPVAAFGLWTVEPYSLSRSVAQKAVIFVHDVEVELSFEGDITLGCGQFQDRTRSGCEFIELGDSEAWWLSSLAGNVLVWYEGHYRYEMTVRPPVTRSVGEQVAMSFMPLSSIQLTP